MRGSGQGKWLRKRYTYTYMYVCIYNIIYIYICMYIYIYYMVPPPPVPRSCPVQVKRLFPDICLCSLVVVRLWENEVSFTMALEASKFSVYSLFALEISPNSWEVLEMLVKPTFSMICLWGIMEIVGFTNNSNNFHDSRNYGLGPGGFSKFMESVGNVGKTNIFHDLSVGNHGNCWFYQHFQQFP